MIYLYDVVHKCIKCTMNVLYIQGYQKRCTVEKRLLRALNVLVDFSTASSGKSSNIFHKTIFLKVL